MGEVSVKHQILGRILCVATLNLISFTVFIALLLSAPSISATTTSVPATVRISSACSLGKSIDTPHEVTLSNGNYSGASGYGQTTLKAFCNDSGGFAIYAIGYTSDEYGNTTMHWNKAASSSDNTNAIPTEVYDTGNMSNSSWSMKLSAVSGTYAATIDDGNSSHNNSTEDFTSWHEIPEQYTRVAYRLSSTDVPQNGQGEGSSVTLTYDTYIEPTQPAGTYTGQVKFTLVHPNDAAAPIAPLKSTDTPNNSIVYAPNASDIIGSMDSISNTKITSSPTAGVQSASANSTATLIAPNYAREGYGFAGWSTDFEATSSSKIYGPNETVSTNPNDEGGLNVSNSNHGAILYPVWIAKETNVTMQTFNSTNYPNYSSAPNGTVIALEDERDHDVYAVAKLADGKWWMIENLRLDDTATITTTNTHNPLTSNNSVALKIDYDNNTTANHLAASSNTWCTTSSTACDDQTMLNTNNTNRTLDPSYNGTGSSTYYQWYGYGNYYNWYSATAGNGTYSKSSGDVDGDLCPTGWHLPYGNSSGTGNTAGGFYYLNTLMSNDTSTQGSKDWRKFPNNFVYSGDFNDASANNRGSNGLYWSRSARSSGSAYSLYLSSSFVYPGTDGSLKNYGRAVRCIAQ